MYTEILINRTKQPQTGVNSNKTVSSSMYYSLATRESTYEGLILRKTMTGVKSVGITDFNLSDCKRGWFPYYCEMTTTVRKTMMHVLRYICILAGKENICW